MRAARQCTKMPSCIPDVTLSHPFTKSYKGRNKGNITPLPCRMFCVIKIDSRGLTIVAAFRRPYISKVRLKAELIRLQPMCLLKLKPDTFPLPSLLLLPQVNNLPVPKFSVDYKVFLNSFGGNTQNRYTPEFYYPVWSLIIVSHVLLFPYLYWCKFVFVKSSAQVIILFPYHTYTSVSLGDKWTTTSHRSPL